MPEYNWYKLRYEGKHGAFIAEYLDDCCDALAILRGEESAPPSMAFRHHMGGRVYDWVATSDFYFILVSARLQQVLRDGGFTGWQTIPAVVEHNKRGLLAHLPQLRQEKLVFSREFADLGWFSALHFKSTLVCWAGRGRASGGGWRGAPGAC